MNVRMTRLRVGSSLIVLAGAALLSAAPAMAKLRVFITERSLRVWNETGVRLRAFREPCAEPAGTARVKVYGNRQPVTVFLPDIR